MIINGNTYTGLDLPIFIPETGGRVFRTVILESTFHDNEAVVADDVSSRTMGISCNFGTNWTTRAITNTLADTAENMSFIWWADLTSEFTTRFGNGTSGNCSYFIGQTYVSVGQVFGNISSKLYITYEYEDTLASTRIKTVTLPIQSFSGRFTTTLQEIGNKEIPALGSYLPEANKNFRDIFFELWANTANPGTSNYQLGLGLSGESAIQDAVHTGTAQSPYLYRYIWKRNNINTGLENRIYGRASITNTFVNMGGNLIVTYEYDHDNSSQIMNSIILGIGEDEGYVPSSFAIAKNYTIQRILDDDGIMLRKSAYQTFINTNNTATNFFIRGGNQSFQSYPTNAQTSQAGQIFISHRVDNEARAGTGIYLATGYNFFTGSWYCTNAVTLSNVATTLQLNYISDKIDNNDANNNHTVIFSLFDIQRAAATNTTVTTGINFIESGQYYLLGSVFNFDTNIASATYAQEFIIASITGESNQFYSQNLYSSFGATANERQPNRSRGLARSLFKRYPNDPDPSRISFFNQRSYSFSSVISTPVGVFAYYTYNTHSNNFTGTIIGYTGNGANIPIVIYRERDKEVVLNLTTSAGGIFTGSYLNGSIDLCAATLFENKIYSSTIFKLHENVYPVIDLTRPETVIITL